MSDTIEKKFWNWFSEQNEAYFHFENNQNYLFSTLKSELNKINPDLTFEFSPILQDNTRELIISADGIVDVFPIVTKLVEQAPVIQNWKIIAFRQPRKKVNQIKYENLVINFSDIFFKYGKDSGKIALELHIRGFYECPEWSAGVFIMLDNILGEYDTEMMISRVQKQLLKESDIKDLFPITKLPEIMQDYKMELSN